MTTACTQMLRVSITSISSPICKLSKSGLNGSRCSSFFELEYESSSSPSLLSPLLLLLRLLPPMSRSWRVYSHRGTPNFAKYSADDDIGLLLEDAEDCVVVFESEAADVVFTSAEDEVEVEVDGLLTLSALP